MARKETNIYWVSCIQLSVFPELFNLTSLFRTEKKIKNLSWPQSDLSSDARGNNKDENWCK